MSNIEKLKNLARFKKSNLLKSKKLDLAKINVSEANLFSIKVREVFLKDDSGKKLVWDSQSRLVGYY